MRSIAEILLSILAICLITESISRFSGLQFGMAADASIGEYIYIFAPSMIYLLSGVFLLIYRAFLADWILRGDLSALPENLDVDKIERVVLSVIGLLIFFSMFPHFLMAINYYVITPEYQKSPYGDIPLEDYAFVQSISLGLEACASAFLMFFPQKVQNILHQTRCL